MRSSWIARALNKRESRSRRYAASALLISCVIVLCCIPNSNRTALSPTDKYILRKVAYDPASTSRARQVALIAPTTFHYRNFLMNLQCSIRRHTGRTATVVALDEHIAKFASNHGFNVIGPLQSISWDHGGTNNPHTFRSSSFRAITKLKLMVVHQILQEGYDVLLTDVDVVWCDDAARLLSQMVGGNILGDILIQSDACRYDPSWIRLNTGFYYAKSTSDVIDLFKETIAFASKPENSHLDDQKSFIQVACNGTKLTQEEVGPRLDMCRWRNRVHIRALPIDSYLNGAVFVNGTRVSKLAEGVLRGMCSSKDIVLWHNNWCAVKDKLQRFHQHDMWFVEDGSGTCNTAKYSVR